MCAPWYLSPYFSTRSHYTRSRCYTFINKAGGFDGSICYQELLLLDLDTMTWIQPKSVAGTPPVARNAQTVCAVGNRLFLFGGHSGNKHLRDLHILDTERMEWSQPEMRGAVPPGLRGHTANLVGHKMFLFGGYDGELGARLHLCRCCAVPPSRAYVTASLLSASLLVMFLLPNYWCV